jgi:hypothetical protein
MKSQKEPKKERKVFVLQWGGDNLNNLKELNADLRTGWEIESVTPMGIAAGSGQGNPIGYCAYSLVRG